MTHRPSRLLFLVSATLLWEGRARAQQAVLQPDRDNTIYSESGALSNGKGDGFFAGVTGQGARRRALLHFNLGAAIPPG